MVDKKSHIEINVAFSAALTATFRHLLFDMPDLSQKQWNLRTLNGHVLGVDKVVFLVSF